MISQRALESLVGLFLLSAIFALVILAFKVSGLTSFFKPEGYVITAAFDDIGQLKVRSPVKMGGVRIGEITNIRLDASSFKAVVSMYIDSKVNDIPSDSSASILTAGLLGDNYISITPMYSNQYLKNGSQIEDTQSALILEKLIGQLIFKLTNSSDKKVSTENTSQLHGVKQ